MDKILSFIKKYTSLLIPAGIIAFGLILFVPTLMIGGSLKAKVDKSVKQGSQVTSYLSKAHSKKDVQLQTSLQSRINSDAEMVKKLAMQTTQRELISYDIFPKPDDTSRQIFNSYGEKYRQEVEGLLRRIKARGAPTEIEIRQELAKVGSVAQTGRYDNRRAYGRRGSNRRQSKDAYDLTKDAFLKKRAQETAIYATANVFDWYGFWEDYTFENQDTALEHCWYSQLAYWVYEDVIETIKVLNAGSLTVINSPVKRLVGVNFNRHADYLPERGRGGYGAMSGGYSPTRRTSNTSGDIPEYVTDAQARGMFGFVPFTGRICDDTVDVIHFNMAVVISSDAVFPFIQELCSEKEHIYKGYTKPVKPVKHKRNQITILQYSQEPVDKLDRVHQRYRYGDSSVVKLSLTCEYIFYKSGYDVIKPKPIVDKLNPEDGTKATNSTGMPGGYPM